MSRCKCPAGAPTDTSRDRASAAGHCPVDSVVTWITSRGHAHPGLRIHRQARQIGCATVGSNDGNSTCLTTGATAATGDSRYDAAHRQKQKRDEESSHRCRGTLAAQPWPHVLGFLLFPLDIAEPGRLTTPGRRLTRNGAALRLRVMRRLYTAVHPAH